MKKIVSFFMILTSCYLFPQAKELITKAESIMYTKKDSANFYLEQAYRISIQQSEFEQSLEALFLLNFLGSYHKDISLLSKNVTRQDSLIAKIDLNGLENYEYYQLYYWFNQGTYHYQVQDYNIAVENFYKIVNYFDEIDEYDKFKEYRDFISSAYGYLATIFRIQQKLEIAEEFYREALRIAISTGQDIDQQLDYYNLIASLKAEEKNYKESAKISKTSIDYYFRTDPNKNLNSLLSTSALLIDNYLQLNHVDSASALLNKIKPYITLRKRFVNRYIKREARLDIKRGDTIKALKSLKSLSKKLDTTSSKRSERMVLFTEIGDVYLRKKSLDSAIYYYKNSISLLTPEDENSPPLDIFMTLNSYTEALLARKNPKSYRSVIELGKMGLYWLGTIKKSFYDDDDKQVFIKNVLPLIENSIDAAYRLNNSEGNHNYMNDAFYFFESSKSSVLYDALQKNSANKYGDIPKEIINKEKILRLQISEAQKMMDLENDSISERNLFKLREDHRSLLAQMEKEYPKYYQLKYQDKLITLDEAIDKNDGSALLSFFYGDKAVYKMLVIDGKAEIIKHKEVDNLTANIGSVLAKIRAKETLDSGFVTMLNQLYKKLIPEAIRIKQNGNIRIIPDGPLSSFPFEALVTDTKTKSFLIERYSIDYQNSIGMSLHLMDNFINNQKLIAFAPNFYDLEDFEELPFAQNEVDSISKYFESQLFVGREANLKNFKSNLSGFDIIHLATHSKVDDAFPEYSYMVFSSQDGSPELLYLNDLYGLEIDASLVTLSACETGLGEYKKGEGLMSLSRAFFYAGAQSLVTTLWNINDKSSSELMDEFYLQLGEGKNKSEAARISKINFINKNRDNPLVHPYYWSGVVIYGNNRPIERASFTLWYWLIGIALILILWSLIRKYLIQ